MGRAERARLANEQAEASSRVESAIKGGTVVMPQALEAIIKPGADLEIQQADEASLPTFLKVASIRVFPDGRCVLGLARDMSKSPEGVPPGLYTLRIRNTNVVGR